MKIFIDTAEISEIRDASALGLVDGVTTNPSLVAKSGRSMRDVLQEICGFVRGPVSAEVLTEAYSTMMEEAYQLAEIAPNIVIKLPMTPDGLRVCKKLSDEGVKTNLTLCFSPLQALLAAKAGATFISPFVGRLDDIGHEGMLLVEQILEVYENYGLQTEVLVASVRSPQHVLEAIRLGADAATIPYSILSTLSQHPLTDAGLARFKRDAAMIPVSS